MPDAQIAASHYESDGAGDGQKLLVNFYAEANPQDPARPFRLATSPGSRLIDNASTLATGVRGLFQSDGYASGKIIVPDGTVMRLMTSAGSFSTVSGTLAGTDRVKAAFGEVQAAFLANGTIYVSAAAGSSLAAASDADWATLLSDHGESAFSSITSMGQRLIATYGSRFGYSTTLEFNTTTTISWYTAESAPDGIIAAKALGSMLYVFGSQTIEPWVQTGDNDDPFQPIVGHVIQTGCAARDTIVELDNTIFFIGDDRTVRRIDGLTASIINIDDPWVTRALIGVDMSTVVCQSYQIDTHSFYVINAPTFCIIYDIATKTFHTRKTASQTTWEWAFLVRVGPTLYGASRLNEKLVELSRAYFSDDMADANTYGTAITRQFTAHLPVKMGRRAISSVRLEGTKGIGLASGQGSAPIVSMYKSSDKGLSYGSERQKSLGVQGAYSARSVWWRCGRGEPEQTVFKFECADPINFIPTRIAVNEI